MIANPWRCDNGHPVNAAIDRCGTLSAWLASSLGADIAPPLERPNSWGGRVTMGRAVGALPSFAFVPQLRRAERPATLLDLGAASFAASGSGRAGLFLAASIQPTRTPSVAAACVCVWRHECAARGVLFFKAAHPRLRLDRFVWGG